MREWDRNVLRKGIYMSRTNARGKNSRPRRDKGVKSETPASGADSAIVSLRDTTTTELAPGARLTYRFVRPTQTALEHAMAGLPTLDGEFVAVYLQRGGFVAGIIARVRDGSWQRNPEVWGSDSGQGGHRVYFGRLQTYLRGDQRFRILALPAWCANCDGDRRVTFLPYADTTGYFVGAGRQSAITADALGYIDEAMGLWEVKYPGFDGMIRDDHVEWLELKGDGTYVWNPPPVWAPRIGKWGVTRTQEGHLKLCFEEKTKSLRCNFLVLTQFEKGGPFSLNWQRTCGDAVVFADRIFRADRPKN